MRNPARFFRPGFLFVWKSSMFHIRRLKPMKPMLTLTGIGLALLLACGCETMDPAGLGNMVSGILSRTTSEPLSLETVVAGLKEALTVGTQNAVATTSKSGGYSANQLIRIPLPQELQTVGKTLRAVGMDSMVDEFEAKMNQAAEAAAAKATPVFVDAIKQMTFADARQILTGGDTAATDYFREKTGTSLRNLYKPTVAQYTNQVGAAKLYKQVMDRYSLVPLVPKPQFASLDDYVTDKAVNGLFTMLGQEETKIRQNPAARTTELLNKVFGTK